MRRQLDLAVEDFITVDVAVKDERVCGLVGKSWKPGIAEEVRAKEFSLHNAVQLAGTAYALIKDWDVEGIAMTIGISKAA